MTKKKKHVITVVSLLAVMAVLLALYFLIPQGEDAEKESAQNAGATIPVVKISADQVTGVEVQKKGEGFSLKKEGDQWKLADMPEAPVDTKVVEGMFGCLNPVKAVREISGGEGSAADYGLEKPQLTVQITTLDGSSYQFALGDSVPAAGGNYAMFNGDKMYALDDSVYSAFDVKKNSLIAKEEVAQIDGDYLTSISVENEGVTTFEAKVVSDSKKVDKYTNWIITKPYKEPLAGATTDQWDTLQNYFTSVTFDELEEYGCDDLKKYGFEKPAAVVKVGYFEIKDGYQIPEETAAPGKETVSVVGQNTNKTPLVPEEHRKKLGYTLTFGKKAEDGSYYVRLNDSQNVYRMSGETAEEMLTVDAYTNMDHCVYSTLATDIEGYDVVTGGKKITVTRETAKDDEGKDKNVWKVNGTQIPDDKEEEFLTPYSKAYLLEFASFAKKDVKPKSDEPVLTIVYHEGDRDVTVKYLPYDGTNFYRVDKNGMDYFLVNKRSVDDAAKAFEGLLDLT